MRRWLSLVIAAIVGMAVMVPAGGAAERRRGEHDRLDAYTAKVNARQFSQLVELGFDVSPGVKDTGNFEVDLVLSPQQRARLASEGI